MQHLWRWSDDHKEHQEESDHKVKPHNLDEEAENMIKKVKHALDTGEGCRVCFCLF